MPRKKREKAEEEVVIVIRIPDVLFQRAQVYGKQESLVNREVMEHAFEEFLVNYQTLVDGKMRFRPISEPTTGITYRGAVPISLREKLVQIANEHGYPILDVYYTAFVRYMEGKGYEDQVSLTLFVSHDLRDFLGNHFFDTLEVRSALVQESLMRFYASYDKLKPRQRQELVIDRVPIEHEMSYEVVCDSELTKRFEELLPKLGVEEHNLLYHAVCQHARELGWAPRVAVSMPLRKDAVSALRSWGRERGLSSGQVIERAAEAFEAWYQSPKRPKSWKPERSYTSSMQPFTGYINPQIYERMEALPHPIDHLWGPALMWFAEANQIIPPSLSTMLNAPVKNSKKFSAILFLPEQMKLVRVLELKGTLTFADFFVKAAYAWIEMREAFGEAIFEDYFSRPSPDGVELETFHVPMPSVLYYKLLSYSRHDGQPLRTLVYNISVNALDDLVDTLSVEDLMIDVSHVKEDGV